MEDYVGAQRERERERKREREKRKGETEMACFAVLAALVLALSCYFGHPLPEVTVQAVRCTATLSVSYLNP